MCIKHIATFGLVNKYKLKNVVFLINYCMGVAGYYPVSGYYPVMTLNSPDRYPVD